ncbi:chloride channel protein [Bernardetia sp.]|uniref:chloride channel protein n=1 Tax=Bernardetia sp. TaxID=1937974 RepID=UPI0025C0A394|nr:chloride channel protein [Bernardetia sp.]
MLRFFEVYSDKFQSLISHYSKKFNGNIIRFLIWKGEYLSDKNFLLVVSIFIGILAGLAAMFLRTTVIWVEHNLASSSQFSENYNYGLLFYPTIGLLITAFLGNRIFKTDFGHGFTDILYSISKKDGKIKFSNIYSRMIGAIFTVGFGGSAGLEAPIVMSGAAIGSNTSSAMLFAKKQRILLVACGVAGTIAAIFDAPIGGVIFAAEVILFDVSIANIVPILLASVAAKLTALLLGGDDAIFTFRLKDAFQTIDVPYCIVLGVACGLLSLYFMEVVKKINKLANKIENPYLKALIGGLFLSALIVIFPPVYGEGTMLLKSLLSGSEIVIFANSIIFKELPPQSVFLGYVVIMLLFKCIASAITIAAGGSGGTFAPSLFLGGVLGFTFARIVNITGWETLSESNFILFGMCAAICGVQYAPLAAIFLIAELTGGYELFVPLMLISAVTYITVTYFEPHSPYTRELIEKGDIIKGDQDKKVLSKLKINKLIEKDFKSVPEKGTLQDLVGAIQLSHRNLFPVLNEEKEFVGMILLNDVRKLMFEAEKYETTPLRDLMQRPSEIIEYGETMDSVMKKFENSGAWNLPVIKKGKYLGFVSKSTIFNKYREGMQEENQQIW